MGSLYKIGFKPVGELDHEGPFARDREPEFETVMSNFGDFYRDRGSETVRIDHEVIRTSFNQMEFVLTGVVFDTPVNVSIILVIGHFLDIRDSPSYERDRSYVENLTTISELFNVFAIRCFANDTKERIDVRTRGRSIVVKVVVETFRNLHRFDNILCYIATDAMAVIDEEAEPLGTFKQVVGKFPTLITCNDEDHSVERGVTKEWKQHFAAFDSFLAISIDLPELIEIDHARSNAPDYDHQVGGVDGVADRDHRDVLTDHPVTDLFGQQRLSSTLDAGQHDADR